MTTMYKKAKIEIGNRGWTLHWPRLQNANVSFLYWSCPLVRTRMSHQFHDDVKHDWLMKTSDATHFEAFIHLNPQALTREHDI